MSDRKHLHYFRPFPYDNIDIYRFLEVFDVTCPVAQHIIKKAVATGKRGHKDLQRDWQDIVDSAQRKLDMLDEDCQVDADKIQGMPLDYCWLDEADDIPDSLGGDVTWFSASEKELGESAVSLAKQESLWYPDDIPGLEWKEATGGLPYKMWTHNEVYYITRLNRKNKDWSCSWTKAVSLNWRHDNLDCDIVAYAVKKD